MYQLAGFLTGALARSRLSGSGGRWQELRELGQEVAVRLEEVGDQVVDVANIVRGALLLGLLLKVRQDLQERLVDLRPIGKAQLPPRHAKRQRACQ